jgi:hypothetical protein
LPVYATTSTQPKAALEAIISGDFLIRGKHYPAAENRMRDRIAVPRLSERAGLQIRRHLPIRARRRAGTRLGGSDPVTELPPRFTI